MQELVTVYMDLALVVVLGSCVRCRLEYCSMFISVSVRLSVCLSVFAEVCLLPEAHNFVHHLCTNNRPVKYSGCGQSLPSLSLGADAVL